MSLLISTSVHASESNKNSIDITYYQELVSNQPNQVVDELTQFIESAGDKTNINDLLEAHYLVLNAYYFLSKREQIPPIAEAGLELAIKNNRKDFEARFLGMLAIAALSEQDHTRATKLAYRASAIAKQLGEEEPLMGEILMLEANVHYETGALKDALRVMVAADKIFTQHGDKKNRAEAMASIALLYDELGQTREAIDYHLRSLELINTEESLIETTITYYNIALTYRNIDELEPAEKYAKLSLEYANKANDEIGAGYAIYELAMLDEARENYEQSLAKVDPLIPLFENSSISGMIILTHLLRARLRAQLGMNGWQQDLDTAEPYVEKSGSLKREIALVRSKAYVYDRVNQPEKALKSYQQWVELNKEQLKEAQEQATRRYQAMYELKEAESKNKLLSTQKQLAETELKARESRQWLLVSLSIALVLLLAGAFYVLIMQVRTKQKFKNLAMIDELTKTKNRRSITQFANEAIDQSRINQTDVCFALIDIDNFKTFNDTYGHDVGDEVLKKVANTILHELRAGDALGRWGGEEWLLVLPHNRQINMPKIFARIQNSMRDANKDFSFDQEITISMGSTTLSPEDENLEEVVKRADEALYRAKDAGRNRLVEG
ncbi:MAG: GGDEF domain-containing protein [Gammaproteobacteria bacterium]|nr:GGDEF domain-containing protein [Gammaproteobacteria bacterium]